jgi:AcrR family transcriptional regulator
MNIDTPDLAAQLAHYPHGRVPRELRRRQVVAEAGQLFVERGFHGTSMDELATRVGVSKPVIYDLVGSKELLFHEIMTTIADDLAARVGGAVAAEPDPAQRLDAGALAFFEFVDEHRGAWEALQSSESSPVSTAIAGIRERQAALVIELLTDGAQALGVAAEPIQIEAAAHAVNGAFEALAAWWQGHPELTPADVAALLTSLVGPGLVALGGEG